jgi:hypothetical protein
MPKRLSRRGTAVLAASLLVAGPVAAACSSGPSYEAWAATDGAAGRINLDDVQEAFKDSSSATEFEKRVNEIYEGDNIVLIRAEQDGNRLVLEGWEDLNNSGEIDDTEDDQIFSIVNQDDQNEMRGYGANSYYSSGFGGGGFLFGYLLGSAFSRGPYFYSTPSTRVGTIRSDRASYRNSTQYRNQVSKNTNYFNNQKRFAGSRFDNASVSRNRQTYLNTQRTSGSFRSSSTGVRSSFGARSGSTSSSFSGSRSSGGFSGFGGSQTIIGINRG